MATPKVLTDEDIRRLSGENTLPDVLTDDDVIRLTEGPAVTPPEEPFLVKHGEKILKGLKIAEAPVKAVATVIGPMVEPILGPIDKFLTKVGGGIAESLAKSSVRVGATGEPVVSKGFSPEVAGAIGLIASEAPWWIIPGRVLKMLKSASNSRKGLQLLREMAPKIKALPPASEEAIRKASTIQLRQGNTIINVEDLFGKVNKAIESAVKAESGAGKVVKDVAIQAEKEAYTRDLLRAASASQRVKVVETGAEKTLRKAREVTTGREIRPPTKPVGFEPSFEAVPPRVPVRPKPPAAKTVTIDARTPVQSSINQAEKNLNKVVDGQLLPKKAARQVAMWQDKLAQVRASINSTRSSVTRKKLLKRKKTLERNIRKAQQEPITPFVEEAKTESAVRAQQTLDDFNNRMKTANEGGQVTLGANTKEMLESLEPGVAKGVSAEAQHHLKPIFWHTSKDPFFRRIWNMSQVADAKGARWYASEMDDFGQIAGAMTEGGKSDLKVARLLDTYEKLPKEIAGTLTPQEKQLFDFLRGKWGEQAELVNRAIPGSLPIERRIKSYIFRLSDKEAIVQGWKNDLEALNLLKQRGKVGVEELDRIRKIEKSLNHWNKYNTILYDYMPREIHVPFLEERIAMDAPSKLSAIKSYKTYLNLVRKKVFDEAVLRNSYDLLPKITNPAVQKFAKTYLKEFLGRVDRSYALDNLSRGLVSLEWLHALGFSVRSAVVNSTQLINTVVDIGPKWTSRGVKTALTPRSEKLWQMSLHTKDVEALVGDYFIRGVPRAASKLRRAAGYLFEKVEIANRKISFLGAYEKGLKQGNKIKFIKRLTDKGVKLEDATLAYADEVVNRTQFVYGRIGQPLAVRKPLGRALGQFSSYTLNELSLFENWARKNPKKLLAYLLISEAGKEVASRYLGIDLGNALGIGIKFKEMGKAAIALSEGKKEKAKLLAKEAFFIPGRGIFPSGMFPAYSTVKKVMTKNLKSAIPYQGQRLLTMGQALAEGKKPQGFAVRGMEDQLLAHETFGELTARTFIARPEIERKQSEEFDQYRVLQDKITKLQREINKAIVNGDVNIARQRYKQITELGVPPSLMGVKNEILRRYLTSIQRFELRKKKLVPAKKFIFGE